VSNVAQAYFELRGLDLQTDITKRTLKAWDESVRLSQIRFQHGDIPKLDLNQFEAERASTAAQLADLEQQTVQKENQLSVLLGHRPMSIPRGIALTDQIMPPEVPPGLPSDLLQRRRRASYLDLLTAQRNLFSAELSLADTRRSQLTAMVQLYKSLGGGWLPEGRPDGPAGGAPTSRVPVSEVASGHSRLN
jgi:multidrug efflux system outer membrane protein